MWLILVRIGAGPSPRLVAAVPLILIWPLLIVALLVGSLELTRRAGLSGVRRIPTLATLLFGWGGLRIDVHNSRGQRVELKFV